MKILVATSNPHKLSEIEEVFARIRSSLNTDQPGRRRGIAAGEIELINLGGLAEPIPEPIEDGDTFAANAELKAVHYARCSGHLCLADDSGLVVDALGGDPGVLSARYAGITGSRPVVDEANNSLLLANLGDLPAERRVARFVCAMVLCGPESTTHDDGRTATGRPAVALARTSGTLEGRILGPGDEGYGIDNPCGRGTNGFGYDPLFVLPDSGVTTAELSAEQKNRISHRGEAACRMWQSIQGMIGKS